MASATSAGEATRRPATLTSTSPLRIPALLARPSRFGAPRFCGGAAAGHVVDVDALVGGQAAAGGHALGHGRRGDAQEGPADRLALLQARDDVADGVGRDREADADVAAAAPGLDLGVDADHAPARVD